MAYSGGVNSTTTWISLGGLSNPVKPLNLTPEPGTLTGFLVAGALVLFRRRVSSAPYL